MNRADFTTAPNGFPLESDATLGFMQDDYQSAIRALAKLSGSDNIILTGLEINNNVATSGWILHNNDLVFFQGGTVLPNFIIEETTVQKANQDGTLIDRYTTKVARFGTGANEIAYSLLYRAQSLQSIGVYLAAISNAGDFGTNWVVISGLQPQGGGVSAGIAIYSNRIITVSAYNGSNVDTNNPIYLTPNGEWSTTNDIDYLKFEPYHNRNLAAIYKRTMAIAGEVIWVVNSQVPAGFFINGLGVYDWEGWAIADGTNGTQDLTVFIGSLTAIQRI